MRNAEEFYPAFESGFTPGAAAAGLVRSRGRTLKWTCPVSGGQTLTIAFRLNRKNLAAYPGEFMPLISWTGTRSNTRDTGEVSFYQYSTPSENDAVVSLQKRIVQKFVNERQLHEQLAEPNSLVSLLVRAAEFDIVPNHDRWLPYWTAEDANEWGRLFGGSIAGWLSRFVAKPETLEGWCQRVLWFK